MTLITAFAALLLLYSSLSARLERTVVTAPMCFTAAGMVLFLFLRHVPSWEGDREFFLRLAEVGLVLLLFTDSSRTDLVVLRNIRNLPTRLLSSPSALFSSASRRRTAAVAAVVDHCANGFLHFCRKPSRISPHRCVHSVQHSPGVS